MKSCSIRDSKATGFTLNLGNAYFKRGMNGKAILNYNRALKLAPSDDISVTTCRSPTLMCRTRIDAVPVFHEALADRIGNSLSSNAGGIEPRSFRADASSDFGATAAPRRAAEGRVLRGFGFVAAFALAVVYAAVGRSQRIHPAEAIVMSTAAPVKSSPDPQSKDIFVLHEGTKVAVGDSLGDWREIRRRRRGGAGFRFRPSKID